MSGKWKGDSNPGGPGGRTRKIQTNQPRGKTSHRAGGGGGKKGGCAVVAFGFLILPALTAGWTLIEVMF